MRRLRNPPVPQVRSKSIPSSSSLLGFQCHAPTAEPRVCQSRSVKSLLFILHHTARTPILSQVDSDLQRLHGVPAVVVCHWQNFGWSLHGKWGTCAYRAGPALEQGVLSPGPSGDPLRCSPLTDGSRTSCAASVRAQNGQTGLHWELSRLMAHIPSHFSTWCLFPGSELDTGQA